MLSIIPMLCGCNYLRTFPLYSEVYVQYYNEIQLFNEKIWVNKLYYKKSDKFKRAEAIKKLVSAYKNENPNVDFVILEAMENFKLVTGMKKLEAEIIAGKPSQKYRNKLGHEVWLYKKWPDVFTWYYKWGKLEFENNMLINIEAQHIDIEK